MYFWGQKYQNPPHVVFRGIARATALHGARKIKPMRHLVADAPQPAPSFSASNESAELLCRHGRHRVKYQFIPTASFHLLFLEPVFPQGDSRLGSDGERASGGLKARAAGRFACKPADSRPTPLSDVRTPTSESVGWLLLLFATEKQVKSFPELYAESSVFTNFFLLVLLGPKVPKSSARRFPRDCANRGAARGAQDQAYAPPRGGRAAARPLFFCVKRECGFIVPPLAAFLFYLAMHPGILFPQGGSRLGSDGGKASGGLKARAAGTVCLQTRAVARRRFQTSGRRHRNRSGGFCCFSPPKSREREKSFFLVLLAPKVQKKKRGISVWKFLSFSTLIKSYQRNWIKARKPDVLILLAEKSRSPEKVL